MKLIKKSILLLALAGGTFLSGGKAYAQQALVDVRVDSAAILIGEQTVLHLTVTTDKDKDVRLARHIDGGSGGAGNPESGLHLDRKRPPADQAGLAGDLFRLFPLSVAPVHGDRRGGYRLL